MAQLTQRTNQFNFTTIRRTEPEIRAASSGGSIVLRVKVRDRFGDYGLVGLVVADARSNVLAVDTLLLSCRVLGRGVEHAILRHLGEIAIERGLSQVQLAYLPTPKNEPARAFAESVAANYRSEESDRVIYSYSCRICTCDLASPGSRSDRRYRGAKIGRKQEFALKFESKYFDLERKSVPTLRKSRAYARIGSRYSPRGAHWQACKRGPCLINQQSLPQISRRGCLHCGKNFSGFDRLGVEDDYFALGGTSLVAARLFAEIERQFGVKLPLTTILESPTVRALSRHLEPRANASARVRLLNSKAAGRAICS